MNSNEKANFDPLTQLPNRLQLDIDLKRELDRAEYIAKRLALLYLDIDLFKRVNDTYGGDIGDLLLTEAAQRLAKVTRAQDFIAYLGEDSFAIIVTEVESTREIGHFAQRIIEDFNQPFLINNHVIMTGLSIGIAYYPEMGNDASELHQHANVALESAKKLGRNNYQFYTEAFAEKKKNWRTT